MALVTLPFTLTNGISAEGPEVQANDNALRDGVNNVESDQIVDGTIVNADLDISISPVTRFSEGGGQNFVVDVENWITTTTSADLNYTVPSFTSYVEGVRLTNAGFVRLYTASRDTYIDQDNLGALTFSEVNNGAAEPSQAAGTLRLLKVVSDASTITDVVVLATGTAIPSIVFFEYRSVEANPDRNIGSAEVLGNQEITLIFRGKDSTGFTLLDTGTAGVTIDTSIKQLVNGMDENIVLTAATPIDVYCIGAADGSQPVGGLLSYQSSPFGTGTPLLPIGYDIFRWVGSLMTTPGTPILIPSTQSNDVTLFYENIKDVFEATNNGLWNDYNLAAFVPTDHVGHVRLTSNIVGAGPSGADTPNNGYANGGVTGSTRPNAQAGAVMIGICRQANSANDNATATSAHTFVPVRNSGFINIYHEQVIDGTSSGQQGGDSTPNGLSMNGWKYKHD